MNLGIKTLMIAVWCAGFAARAAAAPGWLAYGDLRGHIEPCGCDPATDLGGIKRLGTVVERERALNAAIGVFSLGNNLPPPELKAQAVKTPYLLASEAILRPTAILLNLLELQQLGSVSAYLAAHPKEKDDLRYVLSNASAGSMPKFASRIVTDDRFATLGYVTPGAVKGLDGLSPKLFKDWSQLLGKAKGRQSVLLFSGSQADLETVIQAKLFNIIIASNSSPMSADPGIAEKQNEELLRLSKDPPVYAVPLGGQGLLRGGSLLFNEAKPLSAYLNPEVKKSSEPFPTAKLVTWLGIDTGDSEKMKAVYQRYDTAVKAAFVSASAARAKDLENSPFAGNESCASCHPAAAKVYQNSKHAHAMQTLVDKSKQQDGECVACHSVGAAVKGGFVSLEVSPKLANVQCENCHGPRRDHVKDPGKFVGTKVDVNTFCVTCHNRQHSPEFSPAEYWKRIEHGR